MISDSSQHVANGVSEVSEVGDALMEIIERVDRISTLTAEMARAATEQARGLREISMGVSDLDQVTQQNAAMVEQSTAAAHSFGAHADALQASMQRFVLYRTPHGWTEGPKPRGREAFPEDCDAFRNAG